MVCTHRSSRWKQLLQGPEWGLDREQASNVSIALLADIGAETLQVTTAIILMSLALTTQYSLAPGTDMQI